MMSDCTALKSLWRIALGRAALAMSTSLSHFKLLIRSAKATLHDLEAMVLKDCGLRLCMKLPQLDSVWGSSRAQASGVVVIS